MFNGIGCFLRLDKCRFYVLELMVEANLLQVKECNTSTHCNKSAGENPQAGGNNTCIIVSTVVVKVACVNNCRNCRNTRDCNGRKFQNGMRFLLFFDKRERVFVASSHIQFALQVS